jgi:hypothetical protein
MKHVKEKLFYHRLFGLMIKIIEITKWVLAKSAYMHIIENCQNIMR